MSPYAPRVDATTLLMVTGFAFLSRLAQIAPPSTRFVFLGAGAGLGLPSHGPNWAQFQPTLARVDVIVGQVTGPASDQDTFSAPTARVVKSFDVGRNSGSVSFTYPLSTDRPFYVRIRAPTAIAGHQGLMAPRSIPPAPRWT